MITPLQVNAVLSRSQDVTTLKHNTDNKGMVDGQHIQQNFTKEVTQHIKTVHEADNAEDNKKQYDAREKGGNEYAGDGGRNRRKNTRQPDGKVLQKKPGGFDIKI